MATPDPNNSLWNDPKILLAIGGLTVGILGFLFGFFKDRWARRESRLDILAKMLQPMVGSAQCLLRANTNRRKSEQLQHSYPDPEKAPEVVHRVNSMIDEYGELVKSSEANFRKAEMELVSHQFRLPDSVSKSVKALQETLGELGRLVNEGLFDKADVQLAKFHDDYRHISNTARGWRLADPFEGVLKHFRKSPEKDDKQHSEFELTQKEMDGVLELLHKRATTQAQNTFVVHPPKKVCDNPELLESDNVIDELCDSVFSVVFQDGTAKMLSLPELMALNFNLIVLAQQMTELEAMVQAAQPTGLREFQVKFQFSMQEIMQPEMVKILLSKFEFSDVPSDA